MKKSSFILLLIFLLISSAVTAYFIAGYLDGDVEDTEEIEMNYDDSDKVSEVKKDPDRSPFSGIKSTKSELQKRPVAVMYDNHPKARWQAGLSEAEIVYEFPVESPYTRYIGIFLLNSPDSIGPIRSTRPYLAQTVASYDPIYVRCGGSEAGKDEVRRNNISDLDCLTNDKYFKRSSAKKSPNNLYTSMDKVRTAQESLNYSDRSNYEGYNFYDKDTDIGGLSANSVEIVYNKSNSTRYEFDLEKKVYQRYKDGKKHIDETENKNVVAKNIIIQHVKAKVIDEEGRQEIDIIGSGDGQYISNGKVIDITWKKPSASKKISYFNGLSEIKLNEGVTWVQITEDDTDITIQ